VKGAFSFSDVDLRASNFSDLACLANVHCARVETAMYASSSENSNTVFGLLDLDFLKKAISAISVEFSLDKLKVRHISTFLLPL